MSKFQNIENKPHSRKIWVNENILENPEVRIINLKYEKIEKILLSFSIDVTYSSNNYLDPSRPIKINGENVKIPDMPRDPHSLSFVEKKDIDVTDMFRYSVDGRDNRIEIFFRLNQKGWFLKKNEYGKIDLELSIYLPQTQTKSDDGPLKFIFCIFCRKEIPDYSKFCLHCGRKQEGAGREIKKCTTCSESLPDVAIYCKNCGSSQPKT